MTHVISLKQAIFSAMIAASLSLAACSQNEAPSPDSAASSPDSASVSSTLTHSILSANGTELGSLLLEDLGAEGTQITVTVKGIAPGPHAMHFHEIGKCDAPDFKSSGGHYNPTSSSHGHKMADGPHAGDMMNVEADSDGTGTFVVINERVSFSGDHGLPALLDADGTALILHAGADDYESQPSGAAGSRIGCAVVGGEAGVFEIK